MRPRRIVIAFAALAAAGSFLLALALWNSPTRISKSTNSVFLTFDDGPDPAGTPGFLEVLSRHRARATFFLVGANVEKHPELVRRIVAEGHAIGNHSYSHPMMRWMPPWAIHAEMSRTDTLLAPFREGTIPARAPFGGSFLFQSLTFAAMGRSNVLFDLPFFRYMSLPDAEAVARAMSADARPGSILLFHDAGGDRSVELRTVDALIPLLRARGFDFGSI